MNVSELILTKDLKLSLKTNEFCPNHLYCKILKYVKCN